MIIFEFFPYFTTDKNRFKVAVASLYWVAFFLTVDITTMRIRTVVRLL